MKGRKSHNHFILFIAVFSLLLIAAGIFSHYHSRKIIKEYQQANIRTVQTFHIHNRIQEILTDIVIIESKVRGLVISQKETFGSGVQDSIASLQSSLAELQKLVKNGSNLNTLERFSSLINQKISYTLLLLTTYYENGKPEAEKIISTGRGGNLTDSILAVARLLESQLQSNVQANVQQNNQRAQTILSFTSALAFVSVIAILILGGNIIYRLRKQHNLITQQLQIERELKAAKKSADESARVKEQFLANMSHEIRTPVNSIIGFTNLLQKTSLDKEQKQFVSLVQTASENLLSIINDILDISKIEAGMLRIESHSFSLRGLCNSVETMFMPQLKEKNLKFDISIEESLPDTLTGDAVRLTQILVNLISNAIKFTQHGGITLTITRLNQSEKSIQLRFSVKDTGIGIAPDKLSGIFDRFIQGESNTTRKYGGTGLGLSIVKKLINLQKGRISVESRPHSGTNFIFDLEYEVEPVKADVPRTPEENEQVEQLSFNTSKVLVVEDNQMNQLLLHHTFKNWNVNYQLAINGKEAIEWLQKEKFDLVLLDIQMPVMDGYTTSRVIRSELKSNIPIIAMTAHAMPGEREKCLVNGMNDYISKPIQENDLIRLLNKYSPQQSSSPAQPRSFSFIDIDYLNDLMMGNTEFIKTIIQKFSNQFPEEMDSLKAAVKNKSVDEVRNITHDLKSTALFLGKTTPFYNQLEKLEHSAYHGHDWENIVSDYAVLENYSEKVMEETNQLLHSQEEA